MSSGGKRPFLKPGTSSLQEKCCLASKSVDSRDFSVCWGKKAVFSLPSTSSSVLQLLGTRLGAQQPDRNHQELQRKQSQTGGLAGLQPPSPRAPDGTPGVALGTRGCAREGLFVRVSGYQGVCLGEICHP